MWIMDVCKMLMSNLWREIVYIQGRESCQQQRMKEGGEEAGLGCSEVAYLSGVVSSLIDLEEGNAE